MPSEPFVDKHVLAGQATEIVGQAMTTDFANSFDGACKGLIGYHMNVAAAQRVCDQSGLGPQDFQVIELHDCLSANELLLYEALGLCAEGEAPQRPAQGSAQTEAAQFDADPQAAPRPNPTRAPPRHFARSTYRDKVDLITRPAGMPPT